MTEEINNVYENKLVQPGSNVAGSMMGGSPFEDQIIWKEGGIRDRLAAAEDQMASLLGVVERLLATPAIDLDPCPGVTATTFYETAPDGTLRTGVDVAVSSADLVEVALLGAPTVTYASKDAYVDEANPTTNYGSNNGLIVGAPTTSTRKRAWMQFAWGTWGSPPTGLWGAEPILALLRMCKDGSYEHDDLEISLRAEDPAGADWVEGSITWNTQPALEDVARALDYWVNDTTDTYHYFDITTFIYLMRSARLGVWTGTPYGLVLCQRDEATADDDLSYYSLNGAGATNDRKPQIWYWTAVEKSAMLGPTLTSVKFYGSPGATYYLVHRTLDANNSPGRWSAPIAITLPSQGATPSTPSTPTKVDTLISHLKTICLTASVPLDFDHFHVYITETGTSTVTEFNTRVDRFEYWFPFIYASGSGSYQVKYKVVTRSGKESAYSSNLTFSVTSNMKIQSPGAANWLSLIDTSGLGATVLQMAGNVSDFIVSGDDGDYQVITEKGGTIISKNLAQYAGLQWTVDQETAEEATSSASYEDTGTSLSFTTDSNKGEGILLLGIVPRSRHNADNAMGYVELYYKVGSGSWTSLSEAQVGFLYSSYGDKTAVVAGYITVAAGTAVYAKLRFKTNTGTFYLTGRHLVAALRAKNNT